MACRDSRRHHSSGTFFVTSFNKRTEAQVSLPFSNPSFLVYTSLSVCFFCKIAATVVNMHESGVCELPKGIEIASAIAMFTTLLYFAIVSSPSNV